MLTQVGDSYFSQRSKWNERGPEWDGGASGDASWGVGTFLDCWRSIPVQQVIPRGSTAGTEVSLTNPVHPRDRGAEAVRRRRPLAENITVAGRSGLLVGGTVVPIPPFLKMLVSTALRSREEGPICVVLPTVEDIAPVVAMMAALEMHAVDLPSARARFRAEGLPMGQHVRMLPSGEVFEVAERTSIQGMPGLWLHHIQARTRETSPRIFLKLSELDWFEPTTRLAPPATAKTKHAAVPPPNDIDEIVGERSYGNTALNTTRVFLTSSLAGFERTVQALPLCPLHQTRRLALTLERFFSFGRLDDEGHPYVSTPHGAGGHPMVCLGNELLDFGKAALSHAVKPWSRLFLADRLEIVLRDLDLAARIGERQRLVLFAPALHREQALALREHGWTVWEPAPEDLAHLARPQVTVGIQGIDVIERAIRAETTRHPGFLHCPNQGLERAEPALMKVVHFLDAEAAEHDEILQDVRGAAQSAFFQGAGLLDFEEDSEFAQLRENLEFLQVRQPHLLRFLGPDASEALGAFVASIERFLDKVEGGGQTPKGSMILRAAPGMSGSSGNVFVAGHRSSVSHLRGFLARHAIDARCVHVTELREQAGIRSVMALNVMRRDLFARLVDPWPTSAITFAGYDFEIECFARRLNRRAAMKYRGCLDSAARTVLTGMSFEEFPPPSAKVQSVPPPAAEETKRLEDFDRAVRPWNWASRISIPSAKDDDQTVSARVVRFNGRSWAAITDEHRVFALQPGAGDRSIVEETTAAEVKVGTRLIFRDGSSRDVIRSLAESHVGEAKYAKLRKKASIWREAIGYVDHPTIVSRKLAQIGLHRNIQTVRSWVFGKNLIGPRTEDDIHAIARAYPVASYSDRDWAECWNAIRELRALHISAGNRLTDLVARHCGTAVHEASDVELSVDLGIGRVWIVEVAAIDEELRPCPASFANRLHWIDPAWRDRAIRSTVNREDA